MSRLYDFLGAVSKLGLQQISKRSLPKIDGSLKLQGLKEKVEVYRDAWGIPHIYAQNLHDLAYSQGYVQAQERLWQMELNKRVANGTLAEILGEPALEIDIASRTFGFRRIGIEDKKLLKPDMLKMMHWHINGINAYLEQTKGHLPVEFTLTQHKPEPWTIEDTLAFGRLMGWQMSHAWQGQLIRTKIMAEVGEEAAKELEIHYSPNNPTILPDGISVNYKKSAVLKGLDDKNLHQGNGSNSWAVSTEKSSTDGPILANDPHLSLGAPSIWFENHLHCPELHVTGVTIPGFPLVLVGHNERISWGITLAFTDCEDLFEEQMKDEDSSQYLFKGEWKKADVVEEPIFVKERFDPHIEKVILTHHGPVISEVVDEPSRKLCLNSMALKPGPLLESWWGINNATDWDSFVKALENMHAPQLNMVYADVDHNIGYYVTGRVPIRKKGQGSVPVPGWTGEYEWIGEVPFKEMPHCLNPEKGYVVTANHKIVSDDYPHFLGNAWMNGYRANRLEALFAQKKSISLLDSQQMQLDQYSIPGPQFAKHYNELIQLNPKLFKGIYNKAALIMIHWNGQLDAASVGGCLYKVSSFFVMAELLEPALGDELLKGVQGKGFHPVLNGSNEFQGHDIDSLMRILDNPNSFWLKKAGGKKKLLKKAFKKTVDWLLLNVGEAPHSWEWGKIHHAIFPHAMGIKKPLDKVFNLGPFPVGGDGDTPWQMNDPGGDLPNAKIVSASYRQVLDISNWDNCMAVLPPGQSGNISSPHYSDQVSLWLNGELRPMFWSKALVQANATTVVQMKAKKKKTAEKDEESYL